MPPRRTAVRQAAASKDFDLIVAHGFDLVPFVAKYAPEYPDQAFATSLPVDGNPPNVEIYLSVFEQIGYNAGFLAAAGHDDRRRSASSVGPGLPFEKQAEAGFKEAVNKYAPGATVSIVYTGTFEDPAAGPGDDHADDQRRRRLDLESAGGRTERRLHRVRRRSRRSTASATASTPRP